MTLKLGTKSAFQKLSSNSENPMGKSLKRKFRDQGHRATVVYGNAQCQQ